MAIPDQQVGKEERSFKLLFVGDVGTGKTCIIKRLSDNKFSVHYKATIGSDFSVKLLDWDENLKIKLQMWDIAGQERFSMMTRIFYRDAVGAFVVFDVTRAKTFECVEKWKHDLDNKTSLPNGYPIPTVLLANKCDQEGLFSDDKIDKFCEDQGFCKWFETSAKENVGISDAVHFLIEKVLERQTRQLMLSTDRDVITPVQRDMESPVAGGKKTRNSCC